MRRTAALLCLLALGCGSPPAAAPPDLVRVEGGVFRMGDAAGAADEAPVHTVHLSEFWIERCEVTNARYEQFTASTGYRSQGPWRRGFGPGQEDLPVRWVTWHDASAYAAWAGRRLPTEAEWERAARGRDGLRYPWGASWDPLRARADLPLAAGPAAVGSFPSGASPEGCLDMAGNVWEWVGDWYDRHAYTHRPPGVCLDPAGPADGARPHPDVAAAGNDLSTRKVVRGGAWGPGATDPCRGARRGWAEPEGWSGDTGFRCAVSGGRVGRGVAARPVTRRSVRDSR